MNAGAQKRWVLPVALALAAGCTTVAGASSVMSQSNAAGSSKGADVTPGVPPGGPSALYAPPPAIPELQNHDSRFRAPFEMVSGTERYVRGEYLYTGFLYDDNDSTYPTDWNRYANNSANLVEYRMAAYPGGILYRFSFNTLLQKDSTIAALAFDTDRNTATGTSTLPKDPGLAFPGTDQALTTWGTGAQWSTWSGGSWHNVALPVTTDTTANQITVAVPNDVAHPTGSWSATLATGIYDPTTGGWLPIASNSNNKSNIVDLGFRFNETQNVPPGFQPYGAPLYGTNKDNPWDHQTAALQAGNPTQFAHLLNFDWLRQDHNWDNVPTHGMIYRMFASRLPAVVTNEGGAGAGNSTVDGISTSETDPIFATRSEGKDLASNAAQYLSPLQPYLIYVPSHYQPGHPTKLTFALHGDGVPYWWMNDGAYTSQLLGEDRDSIVLSPSARGTTGFYVTDIEHGVFEAWNDVARNYTLDPTRTVMFGGSMGGYGSYRFATLYPQLFARAAMFIPAGSKGLYIPGYTNENATINDWLPNLRNLPIFHFADMFSELTFYPGQFQNAEGPAINGMNSLEALKYRYVFRSVAVDHVLMGDNFPELKPWLANYQVEPSPFHVTYVRMPSSDTPRDDLFHNQDYWLSHIEVHDNSATYAKGTIDAVSLGFGLSDPTTGPAPSPTPGVDAADHPYLQLERTWSDPGRVAAQDRIVINATNIGTVTIDPAAAHVDCHVQLEIHSDGPLKVTLLGCPK